MQGSGVSEIGGQAEREAQECGTGEGGGLAGEGLAVQWRARGSEVCAADIQCIEIYKAEPFY